MKEFDTQFIENQIGYEFHNEDLLIQAFTRTSWTNDNYGENNEVLEFIGDRWLDMIVTRYLTDENGCFAYDSDEENCDSNEFICSLNEEQLTERKKSMVNKNVLAKRIDILDLNEYLFLGKSDIKNHAENSISVKEDLFEAIVGAMALDTNYDFNRCYAAVIHNMLKPETINGFDYINLVNKWIRSTNAEYTIESYEAAVVWGKETRVSQILGFNYNRESYWVCEFTFQSDRMIVKQSFKGKGRREIVAQSDAYEQAYDYLEESGLLNVIQYEISNPNKEEAISQLEILSRRDYFDLPEYKFIQKFDSNGNPLWICNCRIYGIDKNFTYQSSSKKAAKKESAYKMLRYVLSDEFEE